ncbi:uncharacterized protein LOC131145808 [Malania oleifera]|uniref:uncharacterized protein LOC131145808 n=1 Tax=Malania oleifera TaxID=397392 RepID=UPI0025AE1197|nr:uncharacterized protein LOC131145808 [Malania oleifera]
MKIITWNIRGFNSPLKQNGVINLMKKNKVDIFCILETKLSSENLEKLMNKKFSTWRQANNFEQHSAGRILVLWNSQKVQSQILGSKDQVIHCKVTCSVTSKCFAVSFVYGFNSIVARSPLWQELIDFSQISDPWLIIVDFNCVLSPDEKQNGVPVTAYGVKDINDCFCEAGLMDLNSSGCLLTWSKGNVRYKLDRALVNHKWLISGYNAHTEFQFPRVYSDHSSCIVSLFEDVNCGRRPFKFFNIWVNHENFREEINRAWDLNIRGFSQFRLMKKLQALKQPLRNLNSLHFSHISSRAEHAMEEVVEAQ